MSAKHYMVHAKSLICHELSTAWDGAIPRALTDSGWEIGVLGAIRHTAYRCPVNGDGYRYSVQAVCDSTGRVVSEVPYYGPGHAFGEI